MPVAVWDDSLKTGHRIVDRHHQELFQLVNALNDAILAKQGRDVLDKCLDALAQYVAKHFAAEEGLMQQAGYPEMAAHQAEHRKLTAEATKLITDYKSGALTLSATLAMFLVNWLNRHIREVDRRMVAYVRGAGPG
jgi:hemerythrin